YHSTISFLILSHHIYLCGYSILSNRLFDVIGPAEALIALVGEEAVFLCHLNPSMNAEDMEVTWHRNDLEGVVYYYGKTQNNVKHQRQEYQGRTEFLKENITKGQMALRIHPILPSDEGEYSCSFISSVHSSSAEFLVSVTGEPLINNCKGNHSTSIQLTCTPTGWYPEPEVQWRELQGRRLAPDTETMTTNDIGLVLVKSSITVYGIMESGGIMSCFIRNPVQNVEKGAHISIAREF
uniref:Ig-like domain-containing protein n=1 Tax=Otolemur garnettii TaxID=30611 RepID=H0Y077_OTOGA